MAGLLPNYILREWDNSGHLLSGGRIYFYESGTLTPKPTYATYQLNVQNPNPVILDAGGAADIWLGDGTYRVLITDSNGVQIRSPIDGIVGVGAGTIDANSNATMAVLKVYNDLRALTSIPDVVYLTGRTEEGDGGQGLFQYIPVSYDTDDDGVILVTTSGAHVYRRVFDTAIDPRWYGVQYASGTDQSLALENALQGSSRHNYPILLTGAVFLAQNVIVPAWSSLDANLDGFLYAGGSTITVTFVQGSKLHSTGVIFGEYIQPIIQAEVAPELMLSWFGGNNDQERLEKLVDSTEDNYRVVVDISLSYYGTVVPGNFALDFSSGALLQIPVGISVNFGCVVYRGRKKILHWGNPTGISGVSIGSDVIYPEWFGAVGDGVTDDSHAMYAAAKAGRADLADNKTYLLGPIWASRPTPTPLEIRGGTVQLDTTADLGTGTLSLQDTRVVKASGSWFAGAALIANQSEIPPTYTATIQSVTGCVITGSDKLPRFRGKPRLDNGHLDILSSNYLKTDSDGKIQDGGDSLSLSVVNVAKLVLSSLASTPTLKIFLDSTVLTNPMPMFLAVITARYSTTNIFLPVPVKANNDPNLIFVFRRGVWAGQRYLLKSQSGVFYKTGTTTSEEFKDYMIAYFDYDEPGWVTLGSN